MQEWGGERCIYLINSLTAGMFWKSAQRVLPWYQMTSIVLFSSILCTFPLCTTCFWGFVFFSPPKSSSSLHFQTQWAALFCCFISCFLSVLSWSRSLPLSPILLSFMTLLAGNVLGLKLTVLLVCDLSTAFGVQILPLQCFKSVNQVQN